MSLAKAGGCPSSGNAGELGPNLSDCHSVIGSNSQGSKIEDAIEFNGKPVG